MNCFHGIFRISFNPCVSAIVYNLFVYTSNNKRQPLSFVVEIPILHLFLLHCIYSYKCFPFCLEVLTISPSCLSFHFRSPLYHLTQSWSRSPFPFYLVSFLDTLFLVNHYGEEFWNHRLRWTHLDSHDVRVLNFIGFDKWARSRSLSFAVVCITEEVRSSFTFQCLLMVTVKWIMWTTWNMVNSLRTKEYFEIHKILYLTAGLEKHTCYEISMFLWIMFSRGRRRRVIRYAWSWWGWFVILS